MRVEEDAKDCKGKATILGWRPIQNPQARYPSLRGPPFPNLDPQTIIQRPPISLTKRSPMLESPSNGLEGSQGGVSKFLASLGEEPAFLHRDRMVSAVWEDVLGRCRAQREALLVWPRMHLSTLAHRLQGNWSRLSDLLADEAQVSLLANLYKEWQPHLAQKAPPTDNWSNLRRLLTDFVESAHRFNRALAKSLQEVDLTPINRLRRDYNEYYLVERNLALGREDIARMGYEPLKLATLDDLHTLFPPLPIPTLRQS